MKSWNHAKNFGDFVWSLNLHLKYCESFFNGNYKYCEFFLIEIVYIYIYCEPFLNGNLKYYGENFAMREVHSQKTTCLRKPFQSQKIASHFRYSDKDNES